MNNSFIVHIYIRSRWVEQPPTTKDKEHFTKKKDSKDNL